VGSERVGSAVEGRGVHATARFGWPRDRGRAAG
jgi:hypothetical protein